MHGEPFSFKGHGHLNHGHSAWCHAWCLQFSSARDIPENMIVIKTLPINSEVTKHLFHLWDSPHVDLFATMWKASCHRTQALSTKSVVMKCGAYFTFGVVDGKQLQLLPPFSLIAEFLLTSSRINN